MFLKNKLGFLVMSISLFSIFSLMMAEITILFLCFCALDNCLTRTSAAPIARRIVPGYCGEILVVRNLLNFSISLLIGFLAEFSCSYFLNFFYKVFSFPNVV